MKQFTVTQAEAGQRLDKFLGKYLNKASPATGRRQPAVRSWYQEMRSGFSFPMRPLRNFQSFSFLRRRESFL